MGAAKKIQLAPDEIYIQEALKDGRATIQEVSMKALGRPDVVFQARVKHIDMDHVHRLSLIHDQEGRLSPIVVFRAVLGAIVRWIVADGFHRHEVYRRKGERAIRAYVVEVTMDSIEHEARLFSSMCNQVTLLSRTPQDVRRAVEMLFADPVCWEWSTRKIGDHCGCNHNTVKRFRDEFALRNNVDLPEYCTNKDGIQYPTKNYKTKGKITASPVKGSKSRTYRGSFKSREFYGATPEIVEEKIERAKQEIESTRINLSQPSKVAEWFQRRGILAESFSLSVGSWGRITCIKTQDAILAPTENLNIESVFAAIGKLWVFRLHLGMLDARLVTVCYVDSQSNKLLDIARERGIEFLTPDELVASLKGEEGS